MYIQCSVVRFRSGAHDLSVVQKKIKIKIKNKKNRKLHIL